MNVTELIVSTVLGFIFGIIASFISWWILFKYLRPKIEILDSIDKEKSKSGYSVYRMKIANIGSRRAIDVEIHARVRLARVGLKKTTRVVDLALDTDGMTEIRRMYLKPGIGNATVLKVLPNKTKVFNRVSFPQDIREKFKNGNLELEDILAIHPKSYLEVCVFATDELSGARALTISKEYRLTDVTSSYQSIRS